MNPAGTFYSAASLLNPRAKQSKKKVPKDRSKLSSAPAPVLAPSPHALLNPKGSVDSKVQGQNGNGNSSFPSNDGQSTLNAGVSGENAPPVQITSRTVPESQFVFTTAGDDSDDGRSTEDYRSNVGQAALLARSHNTQDRAEQAVKRQKLSTSDNHNWVSSVGGSGISQHFKQKKEEAAMNGHEVIDPQIPAPSVPIDLTTDGSNNSNSQPANDGLGAKDEDVQENAKPEDPEVCIGQVDGAIINLDRLPAIPKSSKALSENHWPACPIVLRKLNRRDMRITAFDCNLNDFGTLAANTAYAISQAILADKISKLVCRLLVRRKRPGQHVGEPVSETAQAQVLVYCRKSVALNLYRQLAKGKAPLRTPIGGSEEWLKKINYYDVEEELYEDGGMDFGGRIDTKTLEKLDHDIFDILNQIPEHNHLIKKFEDRHYIATPLLDYQRQGLQFMTEQEAVSLTLLDEGDTSTVGPSGRSLWRTRYDEKGVVKFYNRATGHAQEEPPTQALGGLLADQMGLGKTLTVISLIASTIDAAEWWCHNAEKDYFQGKQLANVRSTLVIAPLTVLQNWEEQLKQHVVGQNLQILKYYGSGRLTNLADLTDFDVIFTTYGTVQAEMSWRTARDKRHNSLFARFKFFRIVLDEAHYIKGSTTDRAKSIFELQGERRWAITGTPIQNSFTDFGSILKFLRLAPFDNQFKQLVMLPARKDPEIVLARMRLVFNSITLRRTKERLELPRNTKITEHVSLRDDERVIYDRFTREVQRRINDIATEDLSKNYMTFFQQLSSCRRICDSIDLLSNKEKARLEGATQQSADNPENGHTLDGNLSDTEGYKQLNDLDECLSANCSRCDSALLKDQIDEELDGDEIGRFWDCQCFICPDCAKDFENDVKQSQNGNTFTCPETDVVAQVKYIRLTYKKLAAFRQELAQREQEGASSVAKRYTRASSKTEALLRRLAQQKELDVEGSPPHKSVVFTYWSNYLDLLQIDLAAAGYSYLRLDGSVSSNKRPRIIEQFNKDPTVTILLSTIGVGGVGLNLQVANAVFIMEPQWNPATEEQAVDRVHRLGQKRNVTTVRFLVADSVEINVRKMAQDKQALADLTTSNTKVERSDLKGKVHDLLNILQRR